VILWFAIVQVAIACAAGLLCVGLGLARRAPNDLALGSLALVELLLLAQVVVAIVAPLLGNAPTGDLVEFWIYLVSAVVIPVLAALWALLERDRWATVVLGVAALAIAVMVYRMYQIWAVQVA